jgi:trk system potassium uptake protein TrkH
VAGGSSSSLWQRLTPPQLLVGSFLLLIALGTAGLLWLPGLYSGEPMGLLDALFTSTSAVCVTGLVVEDTGTYFTWRGQAFLLVLIQLGGLGILAFTSLIISLLGGRLSLRAESLTAESRKTGPHVDVRRLTLDVIRFTVVIETLGALALYLAWAPQLGWRQAVWPAVFHSVSAFCNAGFSTYSDSLIGFRESPGVLGIIMVLVVIGGIGFVTLEEAHLRFLVAKQRRIRRLSIHSRLVLVTTVVLLLGAWPAFAVFEWNSTLGELRTTDKVTNALFMSTTTRTAGFNTIDYGAASDSTNFLSMLLMTVGGSPGSTAGGMKTTTFALLMLLAWSRMRSHETTIFGNRSIPEDTLQRAVGLTVVGGIVVALGVFALAITGQYGPGGGKFLVRMFEAVSAFNTVGLSMGLTPEMSLGGRCVTILLMFLGRVGPVTFAAALVARRPRKSHFRYAYEDVVVG